MRTFQRMELFVVRVYAKNQKGNLSKRECHEIRRLLEEFEDRLNDNPLH